MELQIVANTLHVFELNLAFLGRVPGGFVVWPANERWRGGEAAKEGAEAAGGITGNPDGLAAVLTGAGGGTDMAVRVAHGLSLRKEPPGAAAEADIGVFVGVIILSGCGASLKFTRDGFNAFNQIGVG